MAPPSDDRPYYRSGETPAPPSRSLFRPVAAGALALIFAGALWIAYGKFHPSDDQAGGVPLIRAEQGPVKVKPDQNSADTGDQDRAVFSMGDQGAKTEKILPPPETPLPKPPPEAPPPVQETPPPVAAPPPAPAAPVVAQSPTPPPAAAAPAKPPPQVAAAPAAASGGPFRVQIAATKDDAAARAEWARLAKVHSDLLGPLSMTVVRADLGDRGVFYRVQAGPVADRAQADKLCGQLKAVSVGCIVVRAQ